MASPQEILDAMGRASKFALEPFDPFAPDLRTMVMPFAEPSEPSETPLSDTISPLLRQISSRPATAGPAAGLPEYLRAMQARPSLARKALASLGTPAGSIPFTARDQPPRGRSVNVPPPDNLILRGLWNMGSFLAPSETRAFVPNMPASKEEAEIQQRVAGRQEFAARVAKEEQARKEYVDRMRAEALAGEEWDRMTGKASAKALPTIPMRMETTTPPASPVFDTSDVFKMMQQRALSEQEDRVAGAMQKIPSLSSDRRVQILRAMGLDWRTPGDRPATVTSPPAPQPPTDWQAEQRAAELRANPELADRIAAERQLTARMDRAEQLPLRDPNIRMDRAEQLLQAFRGRNDAARADQAAQPAYRDEARIAEVAAARQAQRARAQELVSAMARGRRGYVTPENALTMALMRNPQSAAILAQGNMKSQEIIGRLMEARMNAEADANRSRNWIAAQERMAKANNDSEEKRTNIMAGTKAPELSAESLYNIDQIKKSGLPQVEKDRMTAEIIRKDKANPGAAPTTTAPSVNLAALPPSFGDNPTMSSITAALGKLPDEQLTPEFLKKIIAANPSIISENALRDEARNNSPGLWDAAQRLDVWFSPTDPAARQRITDDMFKALPAGKQRALKILKMLNQARLEAARR